MRIVSWKSMFEDIFKENGDSFDGLICCTLSKQELEKEHPGKHPMEGEPFIAWSDRFIYFPAVSETNEWIELISRHPDGNTTNHVGEY